MDRVSAHSANQRGFGVASKRFSEQLREFGVSKRDVRAWLPQLSDHSPKGGQALIDFLGFFQNLASGSSLSDSLRPSQVHQIKFRTFTRSVFVLLEIFKSEDCVTARTPVIHSRRFCLNFVLALLYIVENLLRRLNRDSFGPNNPRTVELEVFFTLLQQVIQALLVNLKVVHHESKLSALLYLLVHVLKDISYGSGNDSVLRLDFF